jgi:hypothetical protein
VSHSLSPRFVSHSLTLAVSHSLSPRFVSLSLTRAVSLTRSHSPCLTLSHTRRVSLSLLGLSLSLSHALCLSLAHTRRVSLCTQVTAADDGQLRAENAAEVSLPFGFKWRVAAQGGWTDQGDGTTGRVAFQMLSIVPVRALPAPQR